MERDKNVGFMYIVDIQCQLGLKVRSNQSMEGCMSVIFPHRHIITIICLFFSHKVAVDWL